MLVWDDGCTGTIGGGRLEWEAIAQARSALHEPMREAFAEEIALGASLGQCCGGAVTLRYALLDEASLAAWPEAALPLIQVYGAGHVGRAVVRVLATLDDVRVQWIDERVQWIDAGSPWIDERVETFPDDSTAARAGGPMIERLCVEPVEAEVALAPSGAFYLVLTHEHALDLRIVEAILRRGDFGFLGLIGSRTKRRRFEQQLARRGVAPEAIARMKCPIGIAGVAGKDPAVIAIAAVAQLLAAMR